MAGKAGASGGGNRTFGGSPRTKPPPASVRPEAGSHPYWAKWRRGMTEKRIANALLRHYKAVGASVADDVHQRLATALFNRNLAGAQYEKWVAEGMSLEPPVFTATGRYASDEIARSDVVIATAWKQIEKGPQAAAAAPAQPEPAADPLAQFRRPALRAVT